LVDEADPSELHAVMKQYLGISGEGASDELARPRKEHEQVRTKVTNILDNITAANREFADERIVELKKELIDLEGKIASLERATAATISLESVAGEMVSLLREFGKVMEEGSTDEKRRVSRFDSNGLGAVSTVVIATWITSCRQH